MDNWKDYIDKKIIPADQFSFDTDSSDMTIIVTHKMTGTQFYFYGLANDPKELHDIQYHNNKTRGWSGEYQGPILFSTDEAKHVDNFLNPAFETGWVSQDTFLFGKHWKSKVYFNLNKTGTPFGYFSSELGCLSFIMFPIFWLLALLFGSTKTVIIDPVKKYL